MKIEHPSEELTEIHFDVQELDKMKLSNSLGLFTRNEERDTGKLYVALLGQERDVVSKFHFLINYGYMVLKSRILCRELKSLCYV